MHPQEAAAEIKKRDGGLEYFKDNLTYCLYKKAYWIVFCGELGCVNLVGIYTVEGGAAALDH